MSKQVLWGVVTGLTLALLQSSLSTAALRWAWHKKFFYWVWGAGLFFRMFVFAATALVIYRFSALNFVATMVTLVTATTLFLVLESWFFLGKK